MTITTIGLVLAVVIAAVAIFPGSLGVLMVTHKMAANALGARLIYGFIGPLYILALGILVWSDITAFNLGGTLTGIAILCTAAFLGISSFGFLLHTTLLFKPVKKPQYITGEEAEKRFGPDEEIVGVLDAQGTPYAYIAKWARRPHIVYQKEGPAPFIMSHCVLAHSSMAYELKKGFSNPDILISSVIANNLVFYDKSNNCSVIQIRNKSTDDRLKLNTLSTLMTRLGTWRAFYPESQIWVRPHEWRDTFYLKVMARASVIDPKSPDLVYPLENEKDERLGLKESVLGVTIDNESKAYPLGLFKTQLALSDTLGSKPLIFFASHQGDYVQLFDRKVDGQVLDFRAEGGGFVEKKTESIWDAKGVCIKGTMEGKKLDIIPHYNKIFWCVWSDFFPETAVYEPQGETVIQAQEIF